MADEKNSVWICYYSKRIQRLPQNMLNSTHLFSNNSAWDFLGKLLYSKVARSRTHESGKTAISHLAKAPVINFWPKQDAKKARRWMMKKPHPVISKGHTINFSRTLKAPRLGSNRRNVFGISKISTTVKQVTMLWSRCPTTATFEWQTHEKFNSNDSVRLPILPFWAFISITNQ